MSNIRAITSVLTNANLGKWTKIFTMKKNYYNVSDGHENFIKFQLHEVCGYEINEYTPGYNTKTYLISINNTKTDSSEIQFFDLDDVTGRLKCCYVENEDNTIDVYVKGSRVGCSIYVSILFCPIEAKIQFWSTQVYTNLGGKTLNMPNPIYPYYDFPITQKGSKFYFINGSSILNYKEFQASKYRVIMKATLRVSDKSFTGDSTGYLFTIPTDYFPSWQLIGIEDINSINFNCSYGYKEAGKTREYNTARIEIFNNGKVFVRGLPSLANVNANIDVYIDIDYRRDISEGGIIVNPETLPIINYFKVDKTSPQAKGTFINFNWSVSSDDNSELLYQLNMCDKSDLETTIILKDFSTDTFFNWDTRNIISGDKIITLVVKDNMDHIIRKSIEFTINKNEDEIEPPIILSFKADKPSPQIQGSQITFVVNAEGKGKLSYRFYIKDSNGKTYILQEYNKSNTYVWNASVSGEKTLYVDVRDEDGCISTKSMNYIITESVPVEVPKISRFEADKASPQVIGTKVTLTVNATGSGELQYKFLVQDADGKWYLLRDFSTSNTYAWTSSNTGVKTIYATVKDGNGNEAKTSMVYNVLSSESTIPVISSFKADKTSPQIVGTQITLTANATGDGDLQYKFLVQDADGKWYLLKDFSTSNTYAWTPNSEGTKTLYVIVKDSNGNEVKTSIDYNILSTESTVPVISSFKADKPSPQIVGTQVTLTANATGSGILQYKFLIQDSDGKWYLLKDFSTSNSYVWTSSNTGTKTLYVIVKDGNGNEIKTNMSYIIIEPTSLEMPTINSFKTDKSSPQIVGTKVTLTVNATGNGILQYKFLVQDSDGKWYLLSDFSSSNTYIWTPDIAGNKTLYVIVKDTNGNEVRTSMSYIILKNEEETVETNYIIDDDKNPITDEKDNNITYKNS